MLDLFRCHREGCGIGRGIAPSGNAGRGRKTRACCRCRPTGCIHRSRGSGRSGAWKFGHIAARLRARRDEQEKGQHQHGTRHLHMIHSGRRSGRRQVWRQLDTGPVTGIASIMSRLLGLACFWLFSAEPILSFGIFAVGLVIAKSRVYAVDPLYTGQRHVGCLFLCDPVPSARRVEFRAAGSADPIKTDCFGGSPGA